jgi:predicted hotdog family 3-hydroxylacyl-ACP dehydratase
MTRSYPPIAEIIPHADHMVLIDEMVYWSEGETECSLTIKKGAPFVAKDQLETPFMLEHMAQTVAACLGYEAFLGGRGIRVGMIIACRKFVALIPFVARGEKIIFRAKRIRGNALLSHFDCEARTRESLIANAELTLYHGESK